MPIYTNDPCDDGLFPVEPSLRSSIGIGPKITKAIDAATRDWLDEHPEATTTVEDNSLTNAKFMDGSVNSRVIEDESIITDDIADLAVTTPKIANDAVTADKIASSAADGLRTMSATQPGVAKAGAGLAMNNGALELNGGNIAPAVTAWLNAHPEATTTVQDGSITDRKLVQTGGVLERVSNLNDDLDNITIEGYEHKLVELELTITDGGYINYRGEFNQLESYMYAETECRPNTTYLITSTKGTGARMYVVLDANRSVIDVAPSETSSLVTVEYETPSAAKYLIVNCAKPYSPSVSTVDTLAFVKVADTDESVSVSHGDGYAYTIHGTRFSYLVNLSGSANGLFKFERIDVEGISGVFKTCGDDITPVNLDVGYVGANHGYYYVYDCVATGHGLTEADIGKTSTDGTNTWMLIQVKDADTIVVGCYRASKWYRLTLTAPTTLDFGTSFTVESATRAQLHPSVKNGEVKFVDSDRTKCLIMETYDIIEVGTGIDALMENVGSNTNESIAELSESAVTVRNLYEFHANGSVTIYQNLKVLKDYITVNSYGGVQSQAFGLTDYYMVPQTTKRVVSLSESANFERETWSNQTVPPVLYIQIDNAPNSYTKAMLLGYVTPNRNADISSNGGNMSNARKMYPYAAQPVSTVDAGKTYSFVSFRVPAFKSEYSQDVPIVSYTRVYDDIYLFLYSIDAVNTSIALPEFMWGKRCEVYMSDGMTCETANIIDRIDLIGTAYSSIILKLSN